jgi:energy-coupling factor transporter ATP-binding protein EcfA2
LPKAFAPLDYSHKNTLGGKGDSSVRITYVGSNKELQQNWINKKGDILLLLYDRWDDFGYKTRFPTICRVNGEVVELGAIRILFEQQHASHTFLTNFLEKEWDGNFPIDDVNYISVPEEITFYEQLRDLLGPQDAVDIALALRDASHLVFSLEDERAIQLVDTHGFRTSLQRERSSQNSFEDGWRTLGGEELGVSDLKFTFRDTFDNMSELALKFVSRSPLPHDVNVIIGPNGVGKSSALRQMIRAWIQPRVDHPELEGARFDPRPNLSQLVAVSYSPFERFPVDTDDEPSLEKALKDKDIYRFFGFRGRHLSQTTRRPTSIRNSLVVPRTNACLSLIQCLVDDRRYGTIKAWANKLRTLEKVLSSAIDFDTAAVRLQQDAELNEIIGDDPFEQAKVFELGAKGPDGEDQLERYLAISPGDEMINIGALQKYVDLEGGVAFFRDGSRVELSSGQRLFCYIVVNVLGVMRRNSLVVVDEPELFLHPTLEIQFVSMLKQLLRTYGSKALVATHSVVTVREVPSRCVHVFEKTDEGLRITNPPFETFGGDVQRISSYVFGDRSVSKPHDAWLKDLLRQYGTADAVIEALDEDLNEEIIIQLNAMERGKW